MNYLENATGFQVIDPISGVTLGGGTFNPNGTTSYTPSMNAPATSFLSSSNPIGNAAKYISQEFNALFGASSGVATGASTTATGSANPTGGSSQPLSQGGSTNPGKSDTSSASIPGTIQNYFMRGIVVVVGFIMLAIGLNMLKPGIVPDPRASVR
jgi:hypothetical protein